MSITNFPDCVLKEKSSLSQHYITYQAIKVLTALYQETCMKKNWLPITN